MASKAAEEGNLSIHHPVISNRLPWRGEMGGVLLTVLERHCG